MRIEVIAEVAQGYEGNPALAAILVNAAAAAGANAVKFQVVYAAELAVPKYKYYDLFSRLEMPDEAWSELATLASRRNIGLYLDIFGPRSLALAESLGTRTVKIHATDLTNDVLLRDVARSGFSRVLLSCGGGSRQEIEHAISVLDCKKLVLLLGFQGYPTPNGANQVARVAAFAQRYSRSDGSICVGFADHVLPEDSLNDTVGALAIGAGAAVLEKHLTLAKVMKFEDHEAALGPDEFALFSAKMAACAEVIGVCDMNREDFGMDESELSYRRMVRRHVVAAAALPAGKTLQAEDVVLKRSADENALSDIKSVCGRRLSRAVKEDEPLTKELLVG